MRLRRALKPTVDDDAGEQLERLLDELFSELLPPKIMAEADKPKSFAPKEPHKLNLPKDTPIDLSHLAKCDGTAPVQSFANLHITFTDTMSGWQAALRHTLPTWPSRAPSLMSPATPLMPLMALITVLAHVLRSFFARTAIRYHPFMLSHPHQPSEKLYKRY